MSKVCAFLADGFEEVEALAVVDLLRRAKVDIKMVSITGSLEVKSSHDIIIQADELFERMDFSDAEMLFLPGGLPGTTNLEAHEGLKSLLIQFHQAGKRLAAICAAPSIFGKLQFLEGKKAVSFPDFEQYLFGAEVLRERVITDGTITTSRGMGTAVDLGLELVRIMVGEEKSEELAGKIQYR